MNESFSILSWLKPASAHFVTFFAPFDTAPVDILPMRPGHTLLVPKAHYARLADLPEDLGAKMGAALPKVVKAVCEGSFGALGYS